jgi:beta-lactamase class A
MLVHTGVTVPVNDALPSGGFGMVAPSRAEEHSGEGTGSVPHMKPHIVLDHATPVDPSLQPRLEELDRRLRSRLGMLPEDAAAGLLDLRTGRLAMIHPDRIEYAASVAKIGILLAWFHAHPAVVLEGLDPKTEHELGLMVKASSNEMATRFSRELGLQRIQEVLSQLGFYDPCTGGGIWVGRHYGRSEERFGDPLADHSHAATVRQLLRFYLLLEQGELISPEASAAMRRIFDSPAIPHDPIKFVKALAARNLAIRRKWGSWQNWLHDSAVVRAPNRHYILVALTHHPRGDEYLEAVARAVDDELGGKETGK